MKRKTRHLLPWQLLSWVIILVIFVFQGMWYYRHHIRPKMIKEGGTYIVGNVGGRVVAAHVLWREEDKVFTISLDDKAVYVEIDPQGDGLVENIVHLEGGHEVYSTYFESGYPTRREVVYRHDDGVMDFVVFDAGLRGLFTQRVRYIEERAVREILFDNEWKGFQGQPLNNN